VDTERITRDGAAYPLNPMDADIIFDHSADGLFLLQLWHSPQHDLARRWRRIRCHRGYWGSINQDTFDDHENVSFAVAFRVLSRFAHHSTGPHA